MSNSPTSARKPAKAKVRKAPAKKAEKPLAERIDEICESIAEGKSLRATCALLGIKESSVRYWLTKDDEAAAQYKAAKELGCDALGDECLDIADEDVTEAVEVQNKRVRIDTRLRLMGKWSQRYADKQLLGGLDGGALKVVNEILLVGPDAG